MFEEQITSNKRKTFFLISGFMVVLMAVVLAFNFYLGGGPIGFIAAAVITAVFTWVSYWKSDTITLAVAGAKEADPSQYQRLHNLVEGLCIAGGLPKPKVYVIEDSAPNAFATGRNPQHAAVAVTTGLLEKMNRVELEGVIAHELSHVRNYDTLVMTLAVTMTGVIVLLSDWALRAMFWGGGRRRGSNDNNNPAAAAMAILGLLLLVVAPIVAKIMQLAISRRREALADASAVQLTRYPPGLISALEKLKADTTVVHRGSRAAAHLWIESPLAREPEEGAFSKFNRLFDTHPPLEERIAALKEM